MGAGGGGGKAKSVILYLPANTFETGSLYRITLSDRFEGAVYALPFFLFNTTLRGKLGPTWLPKILP